MKKLLNMKKNIILLFIIILGNCFRKENYLKEKETILLNLKYFFKVPDTIEE